MFFSEKVLLEESAVGNLLQSGPVVGDSEDGVVHIVGLWRRVDGGVPLQCTNILLSPEVVLLVEGQTGLQHDVQSHSQTPDVHHLA